MQDDEQNINRAFNTYLAEYNSLRTELLGRIQSQNQAINYLMIVLGATLTAIITLANSTPPHPSERLFFVVALALPIVSSPLCFMYFENEIMIHAIGSLLYFDRRKHLMRLTKDGEVLGNVLHFEYLPPSTASVFKHLFKGRWILFCVPTVFPTALVPWYFVSFSKSPLDYFTLTNVPVLLVYGFNLWLCIQLMRSVTWIGKNGVHSKQLDRYQHILVRATDDQS